MKKKLEIGRAVATLTCAASLATMGIALLPASASAKTVTTCANKSITVKPKGAKATQVPVSAIKTEGGVGCAEAYKVIAGGLAGNPVDGWAYRPGLFKAPEGLLPQMAEKGSKKIKYAVRGS